MFHREFGRDAKVWDRNKIVIIPDHYIFTADSLSNRNVDILRDFVREQQLPYFYDVIDDPNGHWTFDAARGQLKRQYGGSFAGVCHTALPEKGHVRPGEVLFGTDSHTCMAGAFGEFATGIGNTDAGFIMGTGKLLVKVPETMRFYLDGALQKGVMAKDVILHVIGEIGFDGATYRAMQWDGPGAGNLSMDDRMTIANMAIEAGGKNGIFAADQKTFDFVNARCAANGTKADYEPAVRRGEPEIRLRPGVRPLGAGADRGDAPEPGQPRARQDARPRCARPRVPGELHGRQAVGFPGVRADRQGQEGRHRHFRGAGDAGRRGRPPQNPVGRQERLAMAGGRGRAADGERQLRACLGGPVDTFGRMNKPLSCISATNRNFPGRMGQQGFQGLPGQSVHGGGERADRAASPTRASIL